MPALDLDSDALPISERVLQTATPIVACLCAQWCGSCRDYRQTFDQLADAHPDLCFVWIDVENQADRVDDLDIDNFPTLLIEDSEVTRFYGPILPHPGVLQRLVEQWRTLAAVQQAPRLRWRLA